eukprot:scpid112800/ scgid29250/ 
MSRRTSDSQPFLADPPVAPPGHGQNGSSRGQIFQGSLSRLTNPSKVAVSLCMEEPISMATTHFSTLPRPAERAISTAVATAGAVASGALGIYSPGAGTRPDCVQKDRDRTQ